MLWSPYRGARVVMIELTNLCNLRCVMCGIWEEKPKRNLGLEEFKSLVSSRAVRNAPVIALTGGEPFMIQDFEDYYRLAAELSPRRHINISSNGYYTDRMLDFLERAERGRTAITISYDGVRSHDAVRRIEGSGDRLINTARRIRSRFPGVGLSLKLTVTNENYGEILDTARQCRDIGVPFRFKTLEKLSCHQGRFPSEVTGPEYDQEILDSITRQAEEVLKLGIDTNRRYIKRLISKNTRGTGPCSCSSTTTFVGIDGKVFLCRKKDPIGNVLDESFDKLWASSARDERITEMRGCPGTSLGLGFTHA